MQRTPDPRLTSRRVGWWVRQEYGRTRLYGLWWPVRLEKEVPFYAYAPAGASRNSPRDGIMFCDRFGIRGQAVRQLAFVMLCDAFDWPTARRLVDQFAAYFLSGRTGTFFVDVAHVKAWERDIRDAMDKEARGNSYSDVSTQGVFST